MRGSAVVVVAMLAACGKNNSPPPPSTGRPGAQPESGPGAHHNMTGGGLNGGGGIGGAVGGPPAAGDPGADPIAQARAMYGTTCVMCHGADGTGNGPAAAQLDPKPRNYTDAAWQAGVTDDQIKQIILRGGKGVGKSAMMPGHPELEAQPALLDGLVTLIRGFGKTGATGATGATGVK